MTEGQEGFQAVETAVGQLGHLAVGADVAETPAAPVALDVAGVTDDAGIVGIAESALAEHKGTTVVRKEVLIQTGEAKAVSKVENKNKADDPLENADPNQSLKKDDSEVMVTSCDMETTENKETEPENDWKVNEKKRKGSPKASDRSKKINLAEKERALFTVELQKLKEEAQAKNLKPVGRDRIKKNIEVVFDKYRVRVGAGETGHIKAMRGEAQLVLEILEKRVTK